MRVKVTKNIMNSSGIIFGLTAGQIVAVAIAVLTAIGTFFLLRDYLVFDAIIWIVFIELAVIAGPFVIRINDMNLLTLLVKMLKGSDKRPYSSKGVFDKDDFNIF